MNDPTLKNAYYFVFTPLGYLNAMEYLYERNLDRRNYLFVIPSTDTSARQISDLAAVHTWNEITFLSPGQLKRRIDKLASAMKLLKMSIWLRWTLSRMSEEDDVIVSHLDNPYARLITHYRQKKSSTVVLVDDGLSTISCYTQLAANGELSEHNPGRGLRANLERIFLSTAPVKAQAIRFFSVFWLELIVGRFLPKSVEKNNLTTLKRLMKPQTTGDYVLFIGQPWVRAGRTGEREYYSAVDVIAAYYRGQGLNFFYIAHRNENRLDVGKRYQTIEADVPLEIFLLRSESLPRILAGFYSTGLLTSFYIFGSKMNYELFWGFSAFSPKSWDPGGITEYIVREASTSGCVFINRTVGCGDCL